MRLLILLKCRRLPFGPNRSSLPFCRRIERGSGPDGPEFVCRFLRYFLLVLGKHDADAVSGFMFAKYQKKITKEAANKFWAIRS